MILVTGATGNVGSEVAAALAERGERVRALVREPGDARLAQGVEAVAGDLGRPQSLNGALESVDRVFLLPGYPGVAEAIREAGAERIVLLSGGSAGNPDTGNAITRYMAAAEREVRGGGLDWTFLRPAAFMSNTLRWLPQLRVGDVVRLPFAGVRTACVDPADIAAVAVAALLEEGHGDRIHTPTGPESLLPEEQVATLAEVLGRDLRFEAQPDDEAREEMLKTTPPDYVDAFFDFYVAGSLDESRVLGTVEDVTGRPPRSFRDWARANAEAFG